MYVTHDSMWNVATKQSEGFPACMQNMPVWQIFKTQFIPAAASLALATKLSAGLFHVKCYLGVVSL